MDIYIICQIIMEKTDDKIDDMIKYLNIYQNIINIFTLILILTTLFW